MDMTVTACSYGSGAGLGILGGIVYEMAVCGAIGAFLGTLAVARAFARSAKLDTPAEILDLAGPR